VNTNTFEKQQVAEAQRERAEYQRERFDTSLAPGDNVETYNTDVEIWATGIPKEMVTLYAGVILANGVEVARFKNNDDARKTLTLAGWVCVGPYNNAEQWIKQ
jgi:hypothetical protein